MRVREKDGDRGGGKVCIRTDFERRVRACAVRVSRPGFRESERRRARVYENGTRLSREMALCSKRLSTGSSTATI